MLYIVRLISENFIEIPVERCEIFAHCVEMTPEEAEALKEKYEDRIADYGDGNDNGLLLFVEPMPETVTIEQVEAKIEKRLPDDDE